MLSNEPIAPFGTSNDPIAHNTYLFQHDFTLFSQEKQLESSPFTNSFHVLKQGQNQSSGTVGSSDAQKVGVRQPQKKTKNIWKRQEQLEFFYATIQFSYNFPYYTLSWEWWKPDRYFNYLQDHMRSIFGINGKLSRHIKAKDQYYKQLFYKKGIKSIDLVEFSLQRLASFVKGIRRNEQRGKVTSNEQYKRVQRFEKAIKQYKQGLENTHRPKQYQVQLQKLMNYSLQVKQTIQKLYPFKPSF